MTLAARGRRRSRGLSWVEALPPALPHAFVGFVPAAARAWSERRENPYAWRRLVQSQEPGARRIGG